MVIALIAMIATMLAMPGAASADAAPGNPPATSVGVLAEPTVAMTSAAQAVQTFRNKSTGWCLDDSAEFGLRTYGCNYGPHQQWNVRAWADGTRQLRNVATGGCIFDKSSTGIGIARCESSRSQSWYVVEVPDGGIRFVNERTNHCLGDKHGSLVSWSCIGDYYPAETIWH